jgi:hypothetical protein
LLPKLFRSLPHPKVDSQLACLLLGPLPYFYVCSWAHGSIPSWLKKPVTLAFNMAIELWIMGYSYKALILDHSSYKAHSLTREQLTFYGAWQAT